MIILLYPKSLTNHFLQWKLCGAMLLFCLYLDFLPDTVHSCRARPPAIFFSSRMWEDGKLRRRPRGGGGMRYIITRMHECAATGLYSSFLNCRKEQHLCVHIIMHAQCCSAPTAHRALGYSIPFFEDGDWVEASLFREPKPGYPNRERTRATALRWQWLVQ